MCSIKPFLSFDSLCFFGKLRKSTNSVSLNIIEALCIASQNGHAEGLNVNEITRQTNLSRPAISHHLKIMKSCGLVEVTQSGTSNYYRLTFMDCTRQLMKLGYLVEEIFSQE